MTERTLIHIQEFIGPQQRLAKITQRLARIPDDAVLFPGHLYSPEPSASMGDTRAHNYVFAPRTAEQWLAMFGG